MSANVRAMEILLVEDNPGDVRLVREALAGGPGKGRGAAGASSSVWSHLHVAADGVVALDFLRRRHAWEDAPRPDLILLDLDLPRIDGWEVLSTIKADAALRTIPVVVLSTSRAEEDMLLAYELRANCCITKPGDLECFIRTVRAIEEFWLGVVRLPVPP
jgi:CheY-like chemotaxis protein